MQNVNYNLIKTLHGKLDNVWRIQKHYLKDAQKNCKTCTRILKKMMDEDNKHIDVLRNELTEHAKRGLK